MALALWANENSLHICPDHTLPELLIPVVHTLLQFLTEHTVFYRELLCTKVNYSILLHRKLL